MTTTSADRALRDDLVRTMRRLLADGLVKGTSGNASVRAPGADSCLVTPSGVAYEAMGREDIVEVALGDRAIEPTRTPSSDTPNHLAIYRARHDVGAIVHTHSPYATAFAVVGRPIPPLVAELAGRLGGPVPVAPPVALGSAELPAVLVDALGGGSAVLMANHGVVAVAADLPTASLVADAVEEAARIAWLATALGEPRELSADDVAWMRDFIDHRYGRA